MRGKGLLWLWALLCLPWVAWADALCDGVDDSMTTGVALSSFITDSAGTIVVTLKHTGALSAGPACGREHITGDDNGLIGLKVDDSGPLFGAQNWTGAAAQCATATYVADTWLQLVWRHLSGNIELFVNGALAQSTPSGNSSGLGNLAQVCGTGDSAGDFVAMTVAEIGYFNVALSDGEIAACGKSRTRRCWSRAPTAHWDFGQVAHGAAADGVGYVDRSANGRTLTASDGANNTGMTGQGGTYLSYQAGGIQ